MDCRVKPGNDTAVVALEAFRPKAALHRRAEGTEPRHQVIVIHACPGCLVERFHGWRGLDFRDDRRCFCFSLT